MYLTFNELLRNFFFRDRELFMNVVISYQSLTRPVLSIRTNLKRNTGKINREKVGTVSSQLRRQ